MVESSTIMVHYVTMFKKLCPTILDTTSGNLNFKPIFVTQYFEDSSSLYDVKTQNLMNITLKKKQKTTTLNRAFE